MMTTKMNLSEYVCDAGGHENDAREPLVLEYRYGLKDGAERAPADPVREECIVVALGARESLDLSDSRMTARAALVV